MERACIRLLSVIMLLLPGSVGLAGNDSVVLRLPGMDQVQARRVVYKTAGALPLPLDLYYPQEPVRGSPRPLVILVNAFGRPVFDQLGMQDWGRLIAVSGLVAVNYESRASAAREDTEDVIAFLRSHSAELQIDGDRLGIWASSGNTLLGVPIALDPARRYIRCAAFYYGMPDEVAALRQDLPLLLIRCGLDEYRANRNIDRFIAKALDADIDLELISFLEGHHAFDLADDCDRSRDIIRRTLEFFRANLLGEPTEGPGCMLTAKNLYTMMAGGQSERALELLRQRIEAKKADRSDNPYAYRELWERSLLLTAQDLSKIGKADEAIAVLKTALEIYPDSFNLHDNLAAAYESRGHHALALENAQKALSLLETAAVTDETGALKEKILQFIRRLEKEQDILQHAAHN